MKIDRVWKFAEGDRVRFVGSWFPGYQDLVGQEGEVLERIRGLRSDAYRVVLPGGMLTLEDSELEAA